MAVEVPDSVPDAPIYTVREVLSIWRRGPQEGDPQFSLSTYNTPSDWERIIKSIEMHDRHALDLFLDTPAYQGREHTATTESVSG